MALDLFSGLAEEQPIEPGSVRVLMGDSLVVLPTLEADTVQCCVTSPPYWGLRDYDHPAQIGAEASPVEYVEHLVSLFREVRRVLRATTPRSRAARTIR